MKNLRARSFRRWLVEQNMAVLAKIVAALHVGGIYYLYHRGDHWAITADTSTQLLLAAIYQYRSRSSHEIARTMNGRTDQHNTADARAMLSSNGRFEEKDDSLPHVSSNGDPPTPRDDKVQAVATAVGWREDPVWYRKCLESLRDNRNCQFVIGGIDGDEYKDDQMVRIFEEVFPDGLVFQLPVALSQELEAIKTRHNLDDSEDAGRQAMAHLLAVVRAKVDENGATDKLLELRNMSHTRKAICIRQPHDSKKAILFTAMVFAVHFAQRLDLDVIFSTDSDTVIHPEALGNVVRAMHSDDRIGGVSGHMQFFHEHPTYISKLASSYYWFQQDVAKIQGATFGFNECQPGPCAGFRAAALAQILPSWVGQTVLGRKMVSNEDRHFTTKILAAGYTVAHVPNAVVATDTPNTFIKWLRQQIRWMRGTMVETTVYPHIMLRSPDRCHPWVVYNITKTRLLPLVTFVAVAQTACTGQLPMWAVASGGVSNLLGHFLLTVVMQMVYLLVAKPNGVGARRADWLWALPAQVWFTLWFPFVVAYSMCTALDGSWGTAMRAVGETASCGGHGDEEKGDGLRRRQQSGWCALWKYTAGALLARVPCDLLCMSLWVLLVVVAATRVLAGYGSYVLAPGAALVSATRVAVEMYYGWNYLWRVVR